MALYKRGKTWWMSFQYDNRHVQKSTKCQNKRDAETVERAFRTQLAKGEVGIEAKPDAPAFPVAVADFLAWARIEHRTKPNTVRSYESTSYALLKFFGDKPLDQIEPGDVEKYKEWRSKQKSRPRNEKSLTKNKATKPWKSTTLKPATINRELALLKILFNFYIRRDLVVKNPVSRVKFFAEDNTQMRVVSTEEERLYLMAASQPLQDFATVMVDTGMRPEEVARIERRNVDLTQGYIFIPFGKTKAAKRKIPLTKRVLELLEKRLRESEGIYPFGNESTGAPVTTLKTAHAGALRRSGLSTFRLYDLRHTFATRFIESGGDIVTLQALLGHSNIQMVTRYAHPTERHQFEAMKRMENVRLENEVKKLAKSA
jgi:integrase